MSETSETMNLDDLELELRKLPGVRAAGFTEADDMLLVQVQVTADSPGPTLSQQAARIAYRHADRPVALEIVRWRTPALPAAPVAAVAPVPAPAAVGPAAVEVVPDEAPAAPGRLPRVRLLAVLTFPDTDELEVHLTFEGRRVIGRSTASSAINGAVSATLEGLAEFATGLGGTVAWVEEVPGHDAAGGAVVACGLRVDEQTVLGIASGGSRIEAAARAALQALNRSLEERLHSPT